MAYYKLYCTNMVQFMHLCELNPLVCEIIFFLPLYEHKTLKVRRTTLNILLLLLLLSINAVQ